MPIYSRDVNTFPGTAILGANLGDTLTVAYDTDTKRRVLALCLSEGVSTRTVARNEGIPHSTVSTWVKEEKANQAPDDEALGDEAEVARELLRKSKVLLAGIALLDPKDQQATASAIDKLIGNYLSLLAGGDTNINLHNEGSADNDAMAQALKEFLK